MDEIKSFIEKSDNMNDEEIVLFIKQCILNMQEKERERFARDLHDNTVQNMIHIIHKLEIAMKYIDKDPIQAKLEISSINHIMKNTIKDMRNVIFDLRPMPFDDLGFKIALENFIEDFKGRYPFDVLLDIDDDIDYLPESTLINIFRIIQEFFINSAKHSKGTKITVKIHFDKNKVHFVLSDDGVGCDLEHLNLDKHYGLDIINNRVAILSGTKNYISTPNNGFILDVFIPIIKS